MIATNIPLGAVIYTKRPLYKHYGVYVGNGRVVHFAAKGFETNAAEAYIQETSLENFLKGDSLFIEPTVHGALSAAQTVARARGEIGKQKGEYNLVFNNCEHFAHWCKYGKKRSSQVEAAVVIAAATTAIVVAAAAAASRKKDDD